MKRIRIYTSAVFMLLLFSSCRDYLTGLNAQLSPVLTTDSYVYGINDSISVTLTNSSYNNIYVKEVYSIVEKESQNNWTRYASFECGNCAENPLAHNQTLSYRGVLVNDPGNYRLICYYGRIPGLADQSKVKLYSNTFTIQ